MRREKKLRPEDEELLNEVIKEILDRYVLDSDEIRSVKSRITSWWKKLRRYGLEPDEVYSVMLRYFTLDLETFEEFVVRLREAAEAGEDLPSAIHGLFEQYKAFTERERRIWRKTEKMIYEEESKLAETILNLMNKYGLDDSLAYAVAVGDMELYDALAMMNAVKLCDIIYDTKLILPSTISDIYRPYPSELLNSVKQLLNKEKTNCFGEEVDFNEFLNFIRKSTPDFEVEFVEDPEKLNLDDWNMFQVDVQDLLHKGKSYIAMGDTLVDLTVVKAIAVVVLGLSPKVLKYVAVFIKPDREYAYVTIPADAFYTIWKISTVHRAGVREELIHDLIFYKPREVKKIIPEIKPPKEEVKRPAVLPPIDKVKKELEENLALEVLEIEPMSLPSFGYVYVATVIDESDKGIVRIILGNPKGLHGEFLWSFITNKKGERLMVYVLREDVIRMEHYANMVKVLPPEEVSGIIIPDDKVEYFNKMIDEALEWCKKLDQAIAIKDYTEAYSHLLNLQDTLDKLLTELADLSYKLRVIDDRRVKPRRVEVQYPDLWEWFSQELARHGINPGNYRENFEAIVKLVGGAGIQFIKKELENEVQRIIAEEKLKRETLEKVFRKLKLPKPAKVLRYAIASIYINLRRARTSISIKDAEMAYFNLLRAWHDLERMRPILESVKR